MSRAFYVYRPGHPRASANGFVDTRELDEEPVSLATNAPILSGRFYENTKAMDGTDIGSRKKHRDYMKATGLAMAGDYQQTWQKQAERRGRVAAGEKGSVPSKTRREVIARKLYEIDKP